MRKPNNQTAIIQAAAVFCITANLKLWFVLYAVELLQGFKNANGMIK